MTSPIFIGYTFCSLLTYGALLAWLTAGPVLLEKTIGISPVQFGWVYAFSGIAFGIGAFLNSQFVSRFGVENMMQMGLLGIFVAGVLMLGLKQLGYINVYVIVGPVVMLLFSVSLVFPNTSAGLFQPFPQMAGFVAALFYSSRMLGGSLSSALLAMMPNHTQAPMAMAFITSALLSWLIFLITIKRKMKQLG
jgi:predicted MFS family arabinose efflux permease